MKEIRREYVEAMSTGAECNFEEMFRGRMNKLTKKQIESVLIESEIYFRKGSKKEELIDYAYNYERNSLGYQVLKVAEKENESTADYYTRLFKEFYQ